MQNDKHIIQMLLGRLSESWKHNSEGGQNISTSSGIVLVKVLTMSYYILCAFVLFWSWERSLKVREFSGSYNWVLNEWDLFF